jgi:hypothetical protein
MVFGPYVLIFLNQTLLFEWWYMATLGDYGIGLCAQHPTLVSIMNTNREARCYSVVVQVWNLSDPWTLNND